MAIAPWFKPALVRSLRAGYGRADFLADLAAGLLVGGTNPQSGLVEIVEVQDHPFMVGVQYHPEFKSKPNHAHPLFAAFVKAAVEKSRRSC